MNKIMNKLGILSIIGILAMGCSYQTNIFEAEESSTEEDETELTCTDKAKGTILIEKDELCQVLICSTTMDGGEEMIPSWIKKEDGTPCILVDLKKEEYQIGECRGGGCE